MGVLLFTIKSIRVVFVTDCYLPAVSPLHLLPSPLRYETFTVRDTLNSTGKTLGGTSSHWLTLQHTDSFILILSFLLHLLLLLVVNSTLVIIKERTKVTLIRALASWRTATVYSRRNQFGLDLIKISASIAFSQFVCMRLSACVALQSNSNAAKENKRGKKKWGKGEKRRGSRVDRTASKLVRGQWNYEHGLATRGETVSFSAVSNAEKMAACFFILPTAQPSSPV